MMSPENFFWMCKVQTRTSLSVQVKLALKFCQVSPSFDAWTGINLTVFDSLRCHWFLCVGTILMCRVETCPHNVRSCNASLSTAVRGFIGFSASEQLLYVYWTHNLVV